MNKTRKKCLTGALSAAVTLMMLLAVVVGTTASSLWQRHRWRQQDHGDKANVLVLPSSCGPMTSCEMGSWDARNYPNEVFTDGSAANVNPMDLQKYDTVFMFASDPNFLTSQQKTDLIAWIFNGGKLISATANA